MTAFEQLVEYGCGISINKVGIDFTFRDKYMHYNFARSCYFAEGRINFIMIELIAMIEIVKLVESEENR